jgi:hypothetical protein
VASDRVDVETRKDVEGLMHRVTGMPVALTRRMSRLGSRSLFLAAVAASCVSAALAGCVESDTEKGPEDEVPADGKLDSFQRPTDHGAIGFGTNAESSLGGAGKHHTWTFSLTGNASVNVYTHPALTSRINVDTVLYLYKRGPSGWGSYVARNDDHQGSMWSTLVRNLGAGEYRVLVKGYDATSVGPFALTVGCEGAGCAAPACLFGDTFGDLLAGTGYRITGDRELRVTDYQSAFDQQRIVVAVQQSAHTDVMTVAQAFAAVDQGVIRRVDLYDEAGARAFVAFEYGAGDNSYGAVFGHGSAAVVSKIHDGDLEACTARAQVCALGADWYTTRTSAAFTRTGSRVITAASQLSGTDAADALAAIRVAYAESTSLANGLTRVDGRKLNVVDLVHTATGTKVRAFEYGAGDSSYGAIYQAGTTTRLASIVDLTYYDCTFAP